jgi:hypothetical protein
VFFFVCSAEVFLNKQTKHSTEKRALPRKELNQAQTSAQGA